MKIACLSTFDILPANDGGRRRYLAVMGELAKSHDVTIVGYDLSNTLPVREYRIADRFHVAMSRIAASDAEKCWSDFARTGRIAHDVLCIREYRLNREFLDLCDRYVRTADVVVVSHPYMIVAALTYARADAIIIHESYNVEYDAKIGHFAGIDELTRLRYLNDVAFAERLACQSAHYVTAVSASDARRLEALYDLTEGSVAVMANGVDAAAYTDTTGDDRARFRGALGITADHDVGVFLGSGYGPNVESYRRLRVMLTDAGFRGTVVLVGSIVAAERDDWPTVSFDEVWLGYVTDEVKMLAITTADFALQFIFEGAGTNLKLFDYMASQTLIFGNRFGFRGVVDTTLQWGVQVDTTDDLRAALSARPWMTDEGRAMVAHARTLVDEHYDWKVIGERFNRMLLGDRQECRDC